MADVWRLLSEYDLDGRYRIASVPCIGALEVQSVLSVKCRMHTDNGTTAKTGLLQLSDVVAMTSLYDRKKHAFNLQ